MIAAADSDVIEQQKVASENDWKCYFLGSYQGSAHKLSGVVKQGKQSNGDRGLPDRLRKIRNIILEKATFQKLIQFSPRIDIEEK